jgi:sialic acid synthase SpsE
MRVLLAFLLAYPRRSLILLVALLVAGIAEGLSLSAILPLLSIASGESAESPMGRFVVSSVETAGLEANVTVMLVVIVGGMCVKSALVLLANRGEIHISLGMATPEEQEQIVRHMEAWKAADRTIVYACTSGYPVPFEQVYLREITTLQERYGSRVKEIGFSGHHLGIALDIAAVTLGATWVERHYTLDRTWKGTDHSASLEPDGLRRLVRDIRAVSKALTYKQTGILDIEVPQREKLKRLQSLHLN